MAGKGNQSGGGNSVPKILNSRLSKHTLGRANEEAIGGKEGENLAEVAEMGLLVRTGDEYVVQVNESVG